jgi:UDP-N-acetylmuramyl pentapeptide phosphotransferase/UDP-N-acetylglucosamine-1-phosphate transferase
LNTLTISLLISFILTALLVRYEHFHSHLTGDYDYVSPQKFHNTNTSRVGGLSILLALLVSGLFRLYFEDIGGNEIILLITASLPAFILGLAEDITKRAGIRIRLLGTAFSALLAGYIFNCWITHTSFHIIDSIFLIPMFSILFTVFAVCGLTNAYNIIDGFNGLASIVAVISLIAISYVGFKVNDPIIFILGMAMIGAILGFFFWNYPKGYIFMGDGGAYLIGFWVAFLSVLLVGRNDSVSPIFALLVNAYPVVETLFSVWRRKFLHKRHPGMADNMHLHSLIYRRVVRWDDVKNGGVVSTSLNSRTSPYLWILHTIAVIPASLLWGNSSLTLVFLVFYIFLYVLLYRRIVKFKVPSWIK